MAGRVWSLASLRFTRLLLLDTPVLKVAQVCLDINGPPALPATLERIISDHRDSQSGIPGPDRPGDATVKRNPIPSDVSIPGYRRVDFNPIQRSSVA